MTDLRGMLAVLPQAEHRDLFIVISLLLLCVFAVSRVVFPKLFVESLSLDKLFGFRLKEDLGATIRPFSTGVKNGRTNFHCCRRPGLKVVTGGSCSVRMLPAGICCHESFTGRDIHSRSV